MKKILKYLFGVLFVLTLCSCTKSDKNLQSYKIKKLNDYLYEITFDDYRYDENLETVTPVEEFGCSSVKNGNFYGRNFDFVFNDVPEFVVKVNASKERHASIGVTTYSGIHKDDDLLSGEIPGFDLMPNFTLDGINDSGVIVSDNVVPKNDVKPLTGTNPNKDKLHIVFIVRYVLDNASSADEAISLLKEKNIYGDLGENYSLHFMIADKDKTYVVEFIDNEMVVEEKQNNDQIMTNYYVNLDYLTENSAGIERYQILKENYEEGSSFEGMWNLMQRVKYSKAYLYDNEIPWLSEFIPQSILKNPNSKEYNEYLDTLEAIKKEYWIARTYEQRNPSNHLFWFTTHNSTYDIKERKLRVVVQEKYDQKYEFVLN